MFKGRKCERRNAERRTLNVELRSECERLVFTSTFDVRSWTFDVRISESGEGAGGAWRFATARPVVVALQGVLPLRQTGAFAFPQRVVHHSRLLSFFED